MKAHARVVAEFVDGRTVLRELRSESPLTLVPHRGKPGLVHLVNSASAPLGGDSLDLTLIAMPGAWLKVVGVAASLVLPGPRPATSRFAVHVEAAEGSTVEYLPDATIVTQRAHHSAMFTGSLDASARLTMREMLVLGRENESPGRLSTETIVRRGRTPVLNQKLEIDSLIASPAVLVGRRVLATDLRVGYEDPPSPVAEEWCSLVPLAAGGSLTTALAHDAVSARQMIDSLNRFC
ncbi:urease accessory protein UreD [Kibdelosporangium philippinense]|uniref:Urease accessory protein UreD n=1 Tax=Kibdelosporangium philippinense TaxID=211113 RepID=A0ABS8ZQV8_9PSEU|nr:urease accessory protein UreD [Kibdelosporangium philippinense]MCE7008996.1 urease accessory protein UreD [Kibdelosporangium philippinense]